MYQRILVPLDGSPLAETILPRAQALAKALNSELILLRVTLNPAAEFSFSDPILASNIIQEDEQESKTYINSKYSQIEKEGVRVSYLLRQGPVAETIVEVADLMLVDLIAMSTHGRSGIKRWLLGSVADRVTHISHVPVMLLRPESSNESEKA